MFTAIINGILAMSMVVSMTTTTIETREVANEVTNTVMCTVFRTEETEEIVEAIDGNPSAKAWNTILDRRHPSVDYTRTGSSGWYLESDWETLDTVRFNH